MKAELFQDTFTRNIYIYIFSVWKLLHKSNSYFSLGVQGNRKVVLDLLAVALERLRETGKIPDF